MVQSTHLLGPIISAGIAILYISITTTAAKTLLSLASSHDQAVRIESVNLLGQRQPLQMTAASSFFAESIWSLRPQSLSLRMSVMVQYARFFVPTLTTTKDSSFFHSCTNTDELMLRRHVNSVHL